MAEPSAWAVAGPPFRAKPVGLWPLALRGVVSRVAGVVLTGLTGDGAEFHRGLEAVDRFHRFGLVAGEAGDDGLASLTASEGVAEEGERVVLGIHLVYWVHL